jgi:hypothetical protein
MIFGAITDLSILMGALETLSLNPQRLALLLGITGGLDFV